MIKNIKKLLQVLKVRRYVDDESGISATETVILFPVLLTLMMAVFDLGQGIVINQKVVSASQIIGDLITRREIVTADVVEDVIRAGELALDPYATTDFGYDIASIYFEEDDEPTVLWRMSDNMGESQAAIDETIGLGNAGEGVVVVSVAYTYQPFFSNFIVNNFNMTERAFLRGRKSATVSCADC